MERRSSRTRRSPSTCAISAFRSSGSPTASRSTSSRGSRRIAWRWWRAAPSARWTRTTRTRTSTRAGAGARSRVLEQGRLQFGAGVLYLAALALSGTVDDDYPMPLFPHERLIAYQVACELLDLVRELRISDAKLRDQGMRAAQSARLNIAEAAGRFSGPDKARVFAIARGEACEVAAAIDIAARSRQCEKHAAGVASAVARRLYALLTALIRR